MVFDLVAGDRCADLLHRLLHQLDREIGNAERADAAFVLEPHQRFEDRRQVHALRRPMHQIEIDDIEPEFFLAGVEGALDGIGCQIFVPHLGGDMQIPTGNARSLDAGTHFGLIAIHFGGVDVAIAEPDGACHAGDATLARELESAEAELRHANALGVQIVHVNSSMWRNRPRRRRQKCLIRCQPATINSNRRESFNTMEKALRGWLESHGLLAIIAAVLGIISLLSMTLVLGGFWLAR